MKKISVLFTAFILAMLFSVPVFASDAPSITLSGSSEEFSASFSTNHDGVYVWTGYKNLPWKLEGSGFSSDHLYSVSTSIGFDMGSSIDMQFDLFCTNWGTIGGSPALVKTYDSFHSLFSPYSVRLRFFVYGIENFSRSPQIKIGTAFSEPTTVTFSPVLTLGSINIVDLGLVTDNQALVDAYNSGYDAGQLVGYESGKTEGYNTGYTAGSDAVKAEVEKNGYDSTEYPKLVKTVDIPASSFTPYGQFGGLNASMDMVDIKAYDIRDVEFIPSHAYRLDLALDVDSSGIKASSSHLTFGQVTLSAFCGNTTLFQVNTMSLDGGFQSSYARGSDLSDVLSLSCIVHGAGVTKAGLYTVTVPIKGPHDIGEYHYYSELRIYDLGSADGSQNQIANQTEQIINSYDSSKGNTSKDNLKSELSPMEESENSLFTSGKSGLDSFTFFDVSSVPAVMAGITFVTSVMTSWFTSAGGLSGVGIVLSCLFTVLIISFVLGLYKYFKK